jgi:hypothetical protein
MPSQRNGPSVGIVGVVMAAAAAAGEATGGRSRLFQLTLAGFDLYAAGHWASAADVRGYNSRRANRPPGRSAVLGLGDTPPQGRWRLASPLSG